MTTTRLTSKQSNRSSVKSRPAATRRPVKSSGSYKSPRYVTNRKPNALPAGASAEQGWVIFALAMFVLLGIGLISAICYVLLLG